MSKIKTSLGTNELIDIVAALDIAVRSEWAFRSGHMVPHTDGDILPGYEDVVRSTDERIVRFEALRDKLLAERQKRTR